MSDMNLRALVGRGRQLLGRMRIGETTDQSAGSYGLLALRLERDLARQARGRSVLVTGADDDAVAVEAAVELAWSLAEELGHTVLIIDAVQGGALSASLGFADKPGLGELLEASTANPANVQLFAQPTRHERIAVLPHGQAHGTTIRAAVIRSLVTAACEHFDFVLVQGSLLVDSERSLAFGSLMDAALLLAVENKSTIDDVTRGQRLLNDCGVRRVALVLGNPSDARDTAV
jgi:hypothetical protein